jgi:hypothetical protein
VLVKIWLSEFLDRYKLIHAPREWPETGSDEWKAFAKMWLLAFSARNVTQVEADAATIRLGLNPPQWRREHIPAMLLAIEEIRQAAALQAVPDDRDTAFAQSKSCEYCSGEGQVIVFHPAYNGSRVAEFRGRNGEVKRGPSTTVAHCVCPMGRWMRGKTAGEMLGRIVDLKDIFNGLSRWVLDDPTDAELLESVEVDRWKS